MVKPHIGVPELLLAVNSWFQLHTDAASGDSSDGSGHWVPAIPVGDQHCVSGCQPLLHSDLGYREYLGVNQHMGALCLSP